MSITWDAPLAAATAAALRTRLAGARLAAVRLEYEARRLRLHFREHTLLVRLHPDEAGLALLDAADPGDDARPLASKVKDVWAPPDDRVLVLELLRVRGSPAGASIVLDLLTNQWNAAVTEGPERIVRQILHTREGARPLRVGHPWAFPPPSDREGIGGPVPLERWLEVLGPPAPGDRRRALLRTFAWTSSLSAPALLGAAAREEAGPGAVSAALEGGWELWRRLGAVSRGEEEGEPVLLSPEAGPQPYPLPLPGTESRRAADLLGAWRAALEAGGESAEAGLLLPAALVERLEARVERTRGRVASLEEELAGLPDADDLQSLGDLLLARFHELPRGARSVTLTGFDGQPVEVELDPEATPHENADAYYDRAARIRRARERLPGLIANAREAWREQESLLERARAGRATTRDVEEALPEEPERGGGDAGPSLPYRVFRSSGGLEIRVGRGARRNDDLTFHHSSPEDIWLHAQQASGAHVILRWNRRDENPPARDLAEAAVLAALSSKARTSGSVPVLWTRRKYVRKPRKAPPGSVVPERVSTLFVEPDATLEERLRAE